MKKTIIHQFDPLIYPVKLWVAITKDNKSLNERFMWKYDNSDIDIDFDNNDGITGLVKSRENNLIGVLIVFENKKAVTISNIAHESSHAVDDIWTRIGEKNVGHEANAYLIGWIAKCINEAKNSK